MRLLSSRTASFDVDLAAFEANEPALPSYRRPDFIDVNNLVSADPRTATERKMVLQGLFVKALWQSGRLRGESRSAHLVT
jgi:hypothetical protein